MQRSFAIKGVTLNTHSPSTDRTMTDAFTTISLTSAAPAPIKLPADTENGSGQAGGTYCVAFSKDKDIPSDSENGSGQAGGTYCAIA